MAEGSGVGGRRGERRQVGASLVELFAGHAAGEGFQAGGGGLLAGRERTGIPGIGTNVVDGETFTGLVEEAQAGCGGGEALVGGETFPVGGFFVVEGHTDTFGIEDSEIVLGERIAKLRGGAKPMSGLHVIASNTGTGIVHGSEVALGVGIVVLSGGEIEFEGAMQVEGNAKAVLVEEGEIVLREVIVMERGGQVIVGGSGVIARQATTLLVKIAEDEFGTGHVLRGKRAEPNEGGVEGGGCRIGVQEEAVELMARGVIAGIGAGDETGDRRRCLGSDKGTGDREKGAKQKEKSGNPMRSEHRDPPG